MIEDLINQFINIGYKPGKMPEDFIDIPVEDSLIILRTGGYLTKVIFLYNGATLSIGWNWMDLFDSLSIWGREQISYRTPVTMVDRFILRMLEIINATKVSKIDKGFINIINDLCNIGTKPFLDWCKDNEFLELENILKPFELNSINESYNI